MTISIRRTRTSFGELVAVEVLQIQCGLWQLGFDPGRFDGLWGPMTENALRRWYAWWRSRQVSAPEPVYEAPPVNRGGSVRIPEEWAEIAAAAMRGRCAREARGAHRAPPVPEPVPIAPPVVVIGPSGQPQPETPRVVRPATASSTPWGTLLLGGAVLGAAVYFGTRSEG